MKYRLTPLEWIKLPPDQQRLYAPMPHGDDPEYFELVELVPVFRMEDLPLAAHPFYVFMAKWSGSDKPFFMLDRRCFPRQIQPLPPEISSDQRRLMPWPHAALYDPSPFGGWHIRPEYEAWVL